jgi:Amt family ammonium transporter
VWASIVIGLVVSPLCWAFISKIKPKLGYDDALDVFGCHGLGGIWGGIATGLFASKAVNGVDGLFFGNPMQLVHQLVAIGVTIALAAVGTFLILKFIGLFTKLRVTPREEADGLDGAQHGESAYPSFMGLD